MDEISLSPADAHVWHVPLDNRQLARGATSILSEGERDRQRRFVTEELRVSYGVAHVALRRILARYVHEPPEHLDFGENASGKPYLTAHPGVEFNLAHSGGLALVAVARGRPIGVDIEHWKGHVEHFEVADYCFSPNERATLHSLGTQGEIEQGFYSAWSRKEAYLKALGIGVTTGLDHFDVSLAPGAPAALLEDRRDPQAKASWVFRDVEVPEGYSAALVVRAPLADVRMLDPGDLPG